jgi:hypothetical protein
MSSLSNHLARHDVSLWSPSPLQAGELPTTGEKVERNATREHLQQLQVQQWWHLPLRSTTRRPRPPCQEIGDPALHTSFQLPTHLFTEPITPSETGVGLLLSLSLLPRVRRYCRSDTGRLVGAVLSSPAVVSCCWLPFTCPRVWTTLLLGQANMHKRIASTKSWSAPR